MSESNTLEPIADQLIVLIAKVESEIEVGKRNLNDTIAHIRDATAKQKVQGKEALEYLQGLMGEAEGIHAEHRDLVARVQDEWPQRVDTVAREAGREQARTFGQEIAGGIVDEIERTLVMAGKRAKQAAEHLEQTSRALTWKTTARHGAWVLGSALAIGLGLWGWLAHVRGEIAAARAEETRLTQRLEVLKTSGGGLDISYCGPKDPRLCARIGSERFGPNGDYAPVKFKLKQGRSSK